MSLMHRIITSFFLLLLFQLVPFTFVNAQNGVDCPRFYKLIKDGDRESKIDEKLRFYQLAEREACKDEKLKQMANERINNLYQEMQRVFIEAGRVRRIRDSILLAQEVAARRQNIKKLDSLREEGIKLLKQKDFQAAKALFNIAGNFKVEDFQDSLMVWKKEIDLLTGIDELLLTTDSLLYVGALEAAKNTLAKIKELAEQSVSGVVGFAAIDRRRNLLRAYQMSIDSLLSPENQLKSTFLKLPIDSLPFIPLEVTKLKRVKTIHLAYKQLSSLPVFFQQFDSLEIIRFWGTDSLDLEGVFRNISPKANLQNICLFGSEAINFPKSRAKQLANVTLVVDVPSYHRSFDIVNQFNVDSVVIIDPDSWLYDDQMEKYDLEVEDLNIIDPEKVVPYLNRNIGHPIEKVIYGFDSITLAYSTKYGPLTRELELDYPIFTNNEPSALQEFLAAPGTMFINPKALRPFKNIEKLYIIGNKKNKNRPFSLTDFSKLKRLKITYSKAVKTYLEDINQLRELEELKLHYNKLKHISLDFSQLNKLKHLSLGGYYSDFSFFDASYTGTKEFIPYIISGAEYFLEKIGQYYQRDLNNLNAFELGKKEKESNNNKSSNDFNTQKSYKSFLFKEKKKAFSSSFQWIKRWPHHRPWQKLLPRSNNLDRLPDSIVVLTSLETANFSSMDLLELPENIGKLEKLKHLDLHRNKLNELPASFTSLNNLLFLDLSNNQEFLQLPEDFGKMTKLRYLNLCGLETDFLPESFAKLVNLQALDLSESTLQDLPEGFGNLVNLQFLNLTDSQIKILPESFSSLRLLSLDLTGTRIEQLPKSFGSMKELRYLKIYNSSFKLMPPSFYRLPKLKILELKINQDQPFDWVSITQIDSLKSVSISTYNFAPTEGSKFIWKSFDQGSPYSNIEYLNIEGFSVGEGLVVLPAGITGLKKLQILSIGPVKITKINEDIGNLINLRSLSLRGNSIKRLPRSIGKLKKLWTLDLSSNQLEGLPEEIGKLFQLESLNLYHNNIKKLPEGIGQLEHLSELNLRENDLTALPISMKNLKNLKTLNIKYNNFKIFPPVISQILSLRNLHIGPGELALLPDEILELPNLKLIRVLMYEKGQGDLFFNLIKKAEAKGIEVKWIY